MAGDAEHMAKMRAARRKPLPAQVLKESKRETPADRRNWLRKKAGWPVKEH